MRFDLNPRTFFYIQKRENGYLLHGLAIRTGNNIPPVAMWKPPRNFDLARRFSSIDNAVKVAKEYGIAGYDVIDRAGHVLYSNTEESEVRRDA